MRGLVVAKGLEFPLGGFLYFVCAVFDDAVNHETTVIVTLSLDTIRCPDHLFSQFQGRENLLQAIIAHNISMKNSMIATLNSKKSANKKRSFLNRM
jgi:hypothetical protein